MTENELIEALVTSAESYLGNLYSTGGNGPTFDCSGLICRAMTESFNPEFPRVTAAAIRDSYSDAVGMTGERRGDFVNFHWTDDETGITYDHIGIVTDPLTGEMINCTTANTVTAIDNSPGVRYDNYNGTFWGPKRVFGSRRFTRPVSP